MYIDLERALEQASREDHDPSAVTAQSLLAQQRSTSRRHIRRWLAALLALVLLVGLVAWYRPRVGPAPAPSPTPTPAFVWNGTDPQLTSFDADEVARRCHMKPGERLFDSSSTRPGDVVEVLPPGVTPSPDDSSLIAPDGARPCALGWQTTPVSTPVTVAEVRAPEAELPRICSRHSGLDLTDHDWHLVGQVLEKGTVGSPVRPAAFVSDSRFMVTCQLQVIPEAATDPNALELSVQQFNALDQLKSEQDPAGCPAISLWGIEEGTTGASSSFTLSASTPVFDGAKLDQRVKILDLEGPSGYGLHARIPVLNGVVLAHREITSRRPIPQARTQQGNTPVTLRLLDASGRTLRTCRPAA